MLESFKRFVLINESMDVMVIGHDPQEKVDTLLDLCNWLYKTIVGSMYRKLPPEDQSRVNHETFSPDGNDHFKDTGIINFYTNGMSEQATQMILSGVKYYLGNIGVHMGTPKPETHGDKLRVDLDHIHKHGDEVYDPDYPEIAPKTAKEKKDDHMAWFVRQGWDHNAVRVYRIPVIARDRNKEPRNAAPELNLANATAHHIFGNLLQLHHYADEHGDGYGPMPAADLLVKIETLQRYHLRNATTPDTVSHGAKGATVFSQGYTEERLERILLQIANICRWAIANHYDDIVVR